MGISTYQAFIIYPPFVNITLILSSSLHFLETLFLTFNLCPFYQVCNCAI